MAGTYQPDRSIVDFVRRKEISYKDFLCSMTDTFSSLQKKARNRPAGQLNKYQSQEMVRKMNQRFPGGTYKRYLKYLLDFIVTNTWQFTQLLFQLGLSLTEAQAVERMFVSGGYNVALDQSLFPSTERGVLATSAAFTTTAATSSTRGVPATSAAITTTVATSSTRGVPATSATITTTVATSSTRGVPATVVTAPTVSLIPPHWSCTIDLVGHRKVELAANSDEFHSVMQVIKKTKNDNKSIAKISRIENPRLYRMYQIQKEYVAKTCPAGHQFERQLYHGTRAENVDSILNSGFDRSLAGVSAGYSFGLGNYFSTLFSYSATSRYAKEGDLLLCDVLIGQSVQGDIKQHVLPFKPNLPNIRYESAVNRLHNPTTYVVYADASIYPAYLIKLGRRVSTDSDL